VDDHHAVPNDDDGGGGDGDDDDEVVEQLLEYGQKYISRLQWKERKQQHLLESHADDGYNAADLITYDDDGVGSYGSGDLMSDEGRGGGYGRGDLMSDEGGGGGYGSGDLMSDDDGLTDLAPASLEEEWERSVLGFEGDLFPEDAIDDDDEEAWSMTADQASPPSSSSSSSSSSSAAAAAAAGGGGFVTDQQLYSRSARYWTSPTADHPLYPPPPPSPTPLPPPEGIVPNDHTLPMSLPLNHPEIVEAVAPELDSIRKAVADADKKLEEIQPVVQLALGLESRFSYEEVLEIKWAADIVFEGKTQMFVAMIQQLKEVRVGAGRI
jgi:hypothetical protein